MAYRTAEQTRWRQMDFILGYEIKLSGSHPQHDICDTLAGKYPKDFVWTGWHPNDICYAVPIVASEEEFWQDNFTPQDCKEFVDDFPEGFKSWITDNAERIEDASQRGTLPYFVKDNLPIVNNSVKKYSIEIGLQSNGKQGDKFGRRPTTQERDALYNHNELHNYSEAQMLNFAEIEKITKYKRGKPMTFEEADNGKANLKNDKDNCAACVLTHELRLRGYDITALPYGTDVSRLLSKDTRSAWLTAKGKMPEFTAQLHGNAKEITDKLEKQTQALGSRYHLGWDNKMGRGHIITAVRTKRGLILYDPQKNVYYKISDIINEMKSGSKLELLRVDRLLIRADLLESLTQTIV